MTLEEFMEREWDLYCRLGIDPFAWRQWYARYHRLPYREQCLIGYLLTVKRQLGELDEMLGATQDIRLPFPDHHRYPVNNGLGPVPMRVPRGPFGIPLPLMPGPKTLCELRAGT